MTEAEWKDSYECARGYVNALLALIDADEVDEAEFSRLMLLYAKSLTELDLENLDVDPEFTREPLSRLSALNDQLRNLAGEKRAHLARQFDDQRSTRKGLDEYTKHAE